MTAETSFYVAEAHRGQGIGRQLKEAIIHEGRKLGYHTLIARAAAGSDASLHLNRSLGFEHVGTLKEVGHKFGKFIDVHVMQLMLEVNQPARANLGDRGNTTRMLGECRRKAILRPAISGSPSPPIGEFRPARLHAGLRRPRDREAANGACS